MKIEKGNKIKVEYEGSLEDGTVFDSSKGREPLEFEAGEGKVIKGFDEAVIGMEEGQEKEFSIEVQDAYGEVKPELSQKIPRNALPKGQDPKVGMGLMLTAPNGQQMPSRIKEVNDEEVVIDMNHPLAGKKLIFKIKIVKVE